MFGLSHEILAALGAIGTAVLALILAAYFWKFISKQDVGTDKMKKLSGEVQKGAKTYLHTEYKYIAIFVVVVAVGLIVKDYLEDVSLMTWFPFIVGAGLSATAGYIGMITATNSSAPTTQAARKSLNKALKIAFRGGSVMGLSVVSLSIIGLAGSLLLMQYGFGGDEAGLEAAVTYIAGFGFGASSIALFARVGGGIYTKAADVGADLAGKVEAEIPEDDPRNPGVIADNVGDNVGDVAGMGADLFESYTNTIIAALTLGWMAFRENALLDHSPIEEAVTDHALGMHIFAIPFLIAGAGIIASIIGIFLVRTEEGAKASQETLLKALRKGTWGAAVVVLILSFIALNLILSPEHFGNLSYRIFGAVVAGLVAGVIIGYITEYYTSERYPPTKKMAESTETGPATFIIQGFATGMESTTFPVVIVSGAILTSFYLAGLYGIAIAAIGMLSTLGVTLSSDAYGPVADNAGGLAEMSGLDPKVRERTDALDALGNTNAATGKGFAIGSAALTALTLTAAYASRVFEVENGLEGIADFSVMEPPMVVGIFLGAMVPFLFCAITMKAVGRSAFEIVKEARRQFEEVTGLLEGEAEPDYQRPINLSTSAALREMVIPGLMAIIVPLLVGFLLGPAALVGFLLAAVGTGFVLAIMMANSGGAWDNAKKYIEAGHHGGKGSDAHKAGVIGDTVGDPFKDTSGPSLNILIKLMSIVSLVFATAIATHAII
ncbi:MAG: sodium-translocating pyrophosphatase [Candidatus Aenigmatarchaeota archaeon]